MTFEQYIRANFSPKYTPAYNQWEMFDGGYERGVPYGRPWKDKKKYEADLNTLFNEDNNVIPLGPSSKDFEPIRAGETRNVGYTQYESFRHPAYHRQYHREKKTSQFFFFKTEITINVINNLRTGDRIHLGLDVYIIEDLIDYDYGTLYQITDGNAQYYLIPSEMLELIKTHHVPNNIAK